MLHRALLCHVFISVLVLQYSSSDVIVGDFTDLSHDNLKETVKERLNDSAEVNPEQNVDGIQLSRDSANDTTEEIAFINETSESSEAQAVENKTSEISHVKSKFKCVQKNYTEGQVSSVMIVNVSELLSTLSSFQNDTNSTENFCVLVLFYANWCHFSAALAPHYNALGRIYPNFDILAIDGSEHNNLNARYGIVGVPTVVLFSNKRLVAKLNESESKLHELVTFVKQFTGIDPVGHVDVTDEDFSGPLPCVATQQTDYVLWISWIFIICCFIFGFSKSSLCHWIIESIQVNWQEAEAQHEHID